LNPSESRRLLRDLSSREDLARQLAALEQDPTSWHRCVLEHGYRLTLQQVEELLCSELDDDDLEKVAGGWEGEDNGSGGSGDGSDGSSDGSGGSGSGTGG
jgi:hypothetical protein